MRVHTYFHNIALIVLALCAFLYFPKHVLASTTVDVQSSTGQNTMCINGKCTTSNSTGKNTVCVNGKCYESTESIHVHEEDGNTSVDTKNAEENVKTEITKPEVTNKNEDLKKKIEKIKKEADDREKAEKEKIKSANFDLNNFIRNELYSLKKFLTFQFLFRK
jgi:hypothetical protein